MSLIKRAGVGALGLVAVLGYWSLRGGGGSTAEGMDAALESGYAFGIQAHFDDYSTGELGGG